VETNSLYRKEKPPHAFRHAVVFRKKFYPQVGKILGLAEHDTLKCILEDVVFPQKERPSHFFYRNGKKEKREDAFVCIPCIYEF